MTDAHFNVHDDADVVAVIRASRTSAACARLLAVVDRMSRTSVLWSRVHAAGEAWGRWTTWQRGQRVGPILLFASLVHIALAAAFGDTAGWLWLVIPIATAAIGLVLTFFGRASVKTAGRW